MSSEIYAKGPSYEWNRLQPIPHAEHHHRLAEITSAVRMLPTFFNNAMDETHERTEAEERSLRDHFEITSCMVHYKVNKEGACGSTNAASSSAHISLEKGNMNGEGGELQSFKS